MSITRYIPNTLTCCNLISGSIATLFAVNHRYEHALVFIIVGAVFDFFDGFAARLFHVSGPMGKELDSLADVITFGLAPSMILFGVLSSLVWQSGMDFLPTVVRAWLPFVAMVMAAFSALRLAKFNIDERQTGSFIGLPTPANALFWGAGLPFIETCGMDDLTLFVCLTVLELFMCWLMVSEVPMFALKFKHWGWRENRVKYIFILISAVMLAILQLAAVPLIILIYIVLSLLTGRGKPAKPEN